MRADPEIGLSLIAEHHHLGPVVGELESAAGLGGLGPFGGAELVGTVGDALVEPGVDGHVRSDEVTVCVADHLGGEGELAGLGVGDGQGSSKLVEGDGVADAVGQSQGAGEVVGGGGEMSEAEVGHA